MWWSVDVTVAGPTDGPGIDSDDVGDLQVALAEFSAVGGGEETRYDMRLSVEADDIAEAVKLAAEGVQRAAAEVGMPDWPVVRLEALTHEELTTDLSERTVPALVGISEIAEILGVTRQRAWALATRHREFPDPVLEVAAGPLWLEEAIEAFQAQWTRQGGRPKTGTTTG